MSDESYRLAAWWGSRQITIEQFADDFGAFLNTLPEIDSIFLSWLNYRPSDKPRFPVPMAHEDTICAATKAQSRYDKPKDKIWPEMGFHLSGRHAGSPEYFRRPEFEMSTIVWAGAYGGNNPHCNHVEIQIGTKRISTGQPWRASELIPLMKLVLRIWQPREMSVDCWRYGDLRASVPDAVGAARHAALSPRLQLLNPLQDRTLLPWVGWLTYLPADLAAKVTIPGEIAVERLDDGGIIATLCDEPFTIDNPIHTARARAMEAAIRPVQS
ncbi:MAG: Imm52 family immunity protein [Roseiarcus sp.]|jgi:hypothetical protein